MTQCHSAQRIVVIGTSGSGKSTTAARIGAALGLPHVELDSLFWQANWQETPDAEFRARVEAAVASDTWIVDGNYSRVRDLIWPRAELIVWLDLPLPTVLYRVIKRTIVRSLTRKVLWNGNQEALLRLFSRESIALWSLQTHGTNRRQYTAAFASDPTLKVRRLRTSTALHNFLGEFVAQNQFD